MLKNRVFVDSSILITALLSSRGGSFYILTQLKNKFHFQINNYVLDEIFLVLNLVRIKELFISFIGFI